MMAEDTFQKLVFPQNRCRWTPFRGERTCLRRKKSWLWFHNRFEAHTTALNDTFLSNQSPFELKIMEEGGLGVFAKEDIKPNVEGRAAVRDLLFAIPQSRYYSQATWSRFTSECWPHTKGRPPAGGHPEVSEFNLVGPFDFVNHGCPRHMNVQYKICVAEDKKSQKITTSLKKRIPAGSQILTNYGKWRGVQCMVCKGLKVKKKVVLESASEGDKEEEEE